MTIQFHKYQATGNDFVMLDNRDGAFDQLDITMIQQLCERRFGIGADGLIWLKGHADLNFEMRYFNADGSRSFCGNGARSAVMFAREMGMITENCEFLAIDGVHTARIDESNKVHLHMSDVEEIEFVDEDMILDTGSPHYIRFCSNLNDQDILGFGREIRYSDPFAQAGINVNLVEQEKDALRMLTYERGVEDETYSCGTGATAAALAFVKRSGVTGNFHIPVFVKGGDLEVTGSFKNDCFTNVHLIGPAKKVFHGEITL